MQLCERRMQVKGTTITADDIRALKVNTFPPALLWTYAVLGSLIFVSGVWVHLELRNMAPALMLVLVGFGNVAFAFYGRLRRVSDIEDKINLMEVTNEIVNAFVKKMDQRRPPDAEE